MNGFFRVRRWMPLAFLGCLGLAACADSPSNPDSGSTFIVDVVGERFYVRAADNAVVTDLDAMRRTRTNRVVSGRVVAGDGGFNAPWSWHLDPETVHVTDFTIELCDGRPSDVEADLPYWTDTVRQYCPWSSLVVGTK